MPFYRELLELSEEEGLTKHIQCNLSLENTKTKLHSHINFWLEALYPGSHNMEGFLSFYVFLEETWLKKIQKHCFKGKQCLPVAVLLFCQTYGYDLYVGSPFIL